MFNFNLVNKAVCDVELSGSAFKLLYLIANRCSMENKESIELHNGWIMQQMGLAERQVRNLTKELVEKGYILKDIIGTSTNKRGNIYSLNFSSQNEEINCAKNDAKNCPLKNNIKINKNNKEKIYNISSSNILKKESIEVDNSLSGFIDNSFSDVPEWMNENKSSKEDLTSTQTNVELRNLMTITEKEDKNKTILQGDFSQRGSEVNEENIKSNISGCNPHPQIPLAPLSQTTEDINKINNKDMTELEVNKILGDAVIESCKIMRSNKSYDDGFNNLKKAFIKLEEMGWQRNDDVVRKYISMFDYAIEEDLKEFENSSKNDFKAVPDTFNSSDNKSIKKETKTRQEANKWQNITINDRPIEEVNDMVLSKCWRLCFKKDYNSGLEELNKYINGLEQRGYEIIDLKDKLINDYYNKVEKTKKGFLNPI